MSKIRIRVEDREFSVGCFFHFTGGGIIYQLNGKEEVTPHTTKCLFSDENGRRFTEVWNNDMLIKLIVGYSPLDYDLFGKFNGLHNYVRKNELKRLINSDFKSVIRKNKNVLLSLYDKEVDSGSSFNPRDNIEEAIDVVGIALTEKLKQTVNHISWGQ